jgi:hypothetical protein
MTDIEVISPAKLDGDASAVSLDIVPPSALEAMQRAEIDIAISTAHRYPRDISLSIRRCQEMALRNAKIAGRCNYALPRAGKKIVGPSVHFARILLPCWRNTTALARVIGADRENAHLQGVCHDLETNTRVAFEMDWPVQPPKNDTDERWKDQINLAKRAGMAVAFRTAVFSAVPMVLFEDIIEEAKFVALGSGKSFTDKRNNAVSALKEIGITQPMLYKALEVGGLESITADHLIWLNAALQSIRDGVMTKEEVFGPETVKAQVPKRTRTAPAKEATEPAKEPEVPAGEVIKEPAAPAPEDLSKTLRPPPGKRSERQAAAQATEPQNLFPKSDEEEMADELLSKLREAGLEFSEFAHWLQSIGAVSSVPQKVTELRSTLLTQATENWEANLSALINWREAQQQA